MKTFLKSAVGINFSIPENLAQKRHDKVQAVATKLTDSNNNPPQISLNDCLKDFKGSLVQTQALRGLAKQLGYETNASKVEKAFNHIIGGRKFRYSREDEAVRNVVVSKLENGLREGDIARNIRNCPSLAACIVFNPNFAQHVKSLSASNNNSQQELASFLENQAIKFEKTNIFHEERIHFNRGALYGATAGIATGLAIDVTTMFPIGIFSLIGSVAGTLVGAKTGSKLAGLKTKKQFYDIYNNAS